MRESLAWIAVLAVVSVSVVVGSPAGSEVKSIPGFDGTLPSKHHAG
jgi:hypothetical protein